MVQKKTQQSQKYYGLTNVITKYISKQVTNLFRYIQQLFSLANLMCSPVELTENLNKWLILLYYIYQDTPVRNNRGNANILVNSNISTLETQTNCPSYALRNLQRSWLFSSHNGILKKYQKCIKVYSYLTIIKVETNYKRITRKYMTYFIYM